MTTSKVYSDALISDILTQVKTIALVGASDKHARPSHEVMEYLLNLGYNVVPVNPRLAGKEILGQIVYENLESIPEAIDMVEVFLNPNHVEPCVQSAIKINAKVVWMQIGVIHEEAAKLAEDKGLTVIMDRCPKREIPRLGLKL